MKKILLFGGIGLVVVVVTAGVTFFLASSHSGGGSVVTTTKVEFVPKKFELGPTYTMPSRVVNLADPGANRYLKIEVVLAFSSQKDKQGDVNKKIEERMTVLQDKLTTILSDMTTTQLVTADGKEQLKKAIMTNFSKVLEELTITEVYFPEFVMQ